MNRTRILHVINSMHFGGAEVLLSNSLAPGGLQDQTENFLVYLMGESSLIDRIDKSVTIIPMEYKGKFDLIRILIKLRKVILDNNIKIVHTHSTPANIYTRLILPSSVKQVHTVHSTYSMNYTTRRHNLYLENKFYFKRRDCRLIFLSDYNRADFLNVVKFKGKAFVLNNFISDVFFGTKTSFYDVNRKRLKIVAIGALREEKNYFYLLEIFSFLKSFNISLDIYGGGDKKIYESIVSNENLKIKFMGQCDNPNFILKDYDLFILPSKLEGFGLSIFEAMVSGIPVMISNLESLKSIIGNNAIYFELDNAKLAAQQILEIFHNKIDINTMAMKAKPYAEQIVKRELYIDKLINIYKEILQEK